MVEKIKREAPLLREPELDGADAQPQGRAPQDGEAGGHAAAAAVSELIEQVWRAAGHLALVETQLAAVRHGPQLRRAARDIAVALGIALAFLTAFALANWAAVSALARPLPGLAAPLLLAAAWIVVGISMLVFALNRGDRVFDWRRIRKVGAAPVQTISAHERARREAQRGMRESLERLAREGGELTGALVSSAVVPIAGGVISAGEHVIDQIDELTDDLGKTVHGGGVINRVADIALLPGRYLASVARTALEGLGDELKPSDQPSSTQARLRKTPSP